MKIKKHPIPKRYISIFLILAMLFILTAGMVPTIGVAALPTHKNGTMTSARTVYCLPSSQGNGMSIGSVSSGEAVKVYWQEGSDYYIEYTVSSGSYSGYKRGYVPTSSVSVSGVGSIGYTSFSSKVTSTQTVYNRSNTSSLQIGSVYSSDTFTVLQEEDWWYYIQYPLDGGGYKRGYIHRQNVVQPVGALEAVSFSKIVGYAYDPVNPSAAIDVHIYIINNSTGAQYVYGTTANKSRGDSTVCPGNHGFELNVNWGNYPAGTYTVKAYAIRGMNPQIGIATYTRNADYFFIAGAYPGGMTTSTQNAVASIDADYESLGLNHTIRAYQSPATIAEFMSVNPITTIHGHGGPGHVQVSTSANTSQVFWYTSIPSMSQADIVAFLTCHSAIAPTGGASMVEAAIENGAKVAIGFTNSVIGAEFWYEHFVDQLAEGADCLSAKVMADTLALFDDDCGNSRDGSYIERRIPI